MNGDAEREFADTNVLVYAVDPAAMRKREQAQALMRRLWEPGRGCISVQSLARTPHPSVKG